MRDRNGEMSMFRASRIAVVCAPAIILALLCRPAWAATPGATQATAEKKTGLELPSTIIGKTYAIAPGGDDSGPGTPQAPWATVDKAAKTIKPGDLVIVRGGLYTSKSLNFGPAGGGPDHMTIYEAAEGERPIFTGPDGKPPAVRVSSWTRIKGIWAGGTWAEKSGFVGVGGSPISYGVQVVDCTFWGYSEGILVGSSQELLITGCRFIRTGWGRFSHGIYMSGGYTPKAMSQHLILDSCIFVSGQGYAIHGWHNPHSCIITRNFTGKYYWSLAYGGEGKGQATDALIANNTLWTPTGQPGREAGANALLSGPRIVFANNILGASKPYFGGPGPESTVTNNMYFHGKGPQWDKKALQAKPEDLGMVGVSAQDVDKSIDELDKIFSGSADSILNNKNIDKLFTAMDTKPGNRSPLGAAGANIGLPFAGNAPNIGRDAPSWRLGDLIRAYYGDKLKDYDSSGEETAKTPPSWKYAMDNQPEAGRK